MVDSAGVRIVINPFPDSVRDPVWTLGAEPDVEIGVLGGHSEYELFRVNGATVLRQGQVYMAGVATTGADRSPATILLSDPTGESRDTLATLLGPEVFVMSVPTDFWMAVRPVTYGNGMATAVSGARIAVAQTDTFSISLFGPDGRLDVIVRQNRVPRSIEAADVARFNDSVLSTVEDGRSRNHYREMFDLMPVNETFPAFSSMHFDGEGNLWVQDYPLPRAGQLSWQVFDQEGLFAARVEIPLGLRVLDMGSDYVLGLVKDELDVERIRRYALAKTPD